MNRYVRHRSLLPDPAWQRLAQVRCVVAGAGGLGSTVIMLLSRLGPVQLDIWDPGVVDEPDLNRQLVYTPADIGERKAGLAAAHVRASNPECTVTARSERLTHASFVKAYGESGSREDRRAEPSGGAETGRPAPTLVLFDCVDSMSARAEFDRIHAAYTLPVFHAAVERSYGQVATLAQGSPGYDAILPAGWRDAAGPPKPIFPHVVTMAASLQVGEFVQWLSGAATPLADRLLHLDAARASFRLFSRTKGEQ